MANLLVRGARQLLTLRGPSGPRRGSALRDLGIIPNGALLIVDGVIREVGPARRVENLRESRGAIEIAAEGRVVLPGFVDGHTHLIDGSPRLTEYEMRIAGAGQEPFASAGFSISAGGREIRDTPSRRLELQARKTLKAFARHGTTTVESNSGYGVDEGADLKVLRVLRALNGALLEVVPTAMGVHTLRPELENRASEQIEQVCLRLLPAVVRRKLARFAGICCNGQFSPRQARRYLEAAKRLTLIPRVAAAPGWEAEAIGLATELGAASVDLAGEASGEDAARLAQSDVIATLLPGIAFHTNRAVRAPARRLIEAGAAVALATGFNAGTSPTCSLPMILSLACAQIGMTPAEAISAATINAAHSLRLAHRIGSLECGKQADLVVMNASDYREIPYYFGVNHVAMTIKRGDVIYPKLGAA